MSDKYETGLDTSVLALRCGKCDRDLETLPVTLSYMDSAFPVELPGCPECGMVYVPEELAKGKILHVEKSLEDK